MRFEIELPDDFSDFGANKLTAEEAAGLGHLVWQQLPTMLHVPVPAPIAAALAGPADDLGVMGDAALVYLRAAARRQLQPKE